MCEAQKHFYLQNADRSADELVGIQGMYVLGESCYIMMSIGSGFSWDQVKEKTESLYDILETACSVLNELMIYHSREFLHGDIKPANIYIFQKIALPLN